MCGITLFIGSDPNRDISKKRKHFLELSKKFVIVVRIGMEFI